MLTIWGRHQPSGAASCSAVPVSYNPPYGCNWFTRLADSVPDQIAPLRSVRQPLGAVQVLPSHCLQRRQSRASVATRAFWRHNAASSTQQHNPSYYMAVAPAPSAAQPQPQPTSQGPWGYSPVWWMALVVCTTIVCISSAVTAFILYARPLFKGMMRASIAAEQAAKQMEKASIEMEKTALMFQLDVPETMDQVEAVSREFEELGRSLNALTGGLQRGVRQPVEAVQSTTRSSMQKVVRDVASLTSALTPAMDQWRKRISRAMVSFEQASTEEQRQLAENSASGSAPQEAAVAALAATSVQAPGSQGKKEGGGVGWGLMDGLVGKVVNPLGKQNGAAKSLRDAARAIEAKSGRNATLAAATPSLAAAASSANGATTSSANGSAQKSKFNGAGVLQERERDAGVAASGRVLEEEEELERRLEARDPRELTADELRQLEALQGRRRAAEAVFEALSRAESAAAAAAQASGALEAVLMEAETRGALAGIDLFPEASGFGAPNVTASEDANIDPEPPAPSPSNGSSGSATAALSTSPAASAAAPTPSSASPAVSPLAPKSLGGRGPGQGVVVQSTVGQVGLAGRGQMVKGERLSAGVGRPWRRLSEKEVLRREVAAVRRAVGLQLERLDGFRERSKGRIRRS